MATLGSRKVTAIVVPANVTGDGKEMVVEFQHGLATVPKKVKRFLLERSPELYFDPRVGENAGGKFSDDYTAIEYYIAKVKHSGSAPKLCALLKGHYESLQGELMSGKYNVKTEEPGKKVMKDKAIEEDDDGDENDEALATGAGDKIKSKKNKD